MRLLCMDWAPPEPFTPLFDQVLDFFKVPDETIGENDVILYGGGVDIDPKYYGQTPNFWTQAPHQLRDEVEMQAFNTFKGKVRGFIGICRGAQLLTVLHGGKLVQHIGREHCRDHWIVDFATGQRLPVTSAHHQMCYPFDIPKEKYQILAATPRPIARTYEFESLNQQANVEIEPEVIWFPETRSLGIQGHPEWVNKKHIFAQYSCDLVRRYILGKE